MKICLDIQAALAQRAGIGQYTRALAEHLGAASGGDSLRLFYFDFRRRGAPWLAPDLEQKTIRWCPGRLAQKYWRYCDWPTFDRLAGAADLYHFPNYIIPPLSSGKAVVTIHDVSFLRYPDLAEARNLLYLKRQIARSIGRADAIITDSHFSAGEIAAALKVAPERIQPIPLGIAARFAPPSPQAIAALRQAKNLARPYLLMVGTLEPRKNHAFLVEVFENLPRFDGQLVIAGMRGWRYEPILQRMRQSTRCADIRYLDYLTDAELPALYAGAELFLFPSLYEGFGFPPLEAMACGTPVLSSTGGALAEVLGQGALLLDNFDSARWAAAAERLLDDSAARQALIAQGRQQAARYRWQETARQTWQLYRQVAA